MTLQKFLGLPWIAVVCGGFECWCCSCYCGSCCGCFGSCCCACFCCGCGCCGCGCLLFDSIHDVWWRASKSPSIKLWQPQVISPEESTGKIDSYHAIYNLLIITIIIRFHVYVRILLKLQVFKIFGWRFWYGQKSVTTSDLSFKFFQLPYILLGSRIFVPHQWTSTLDVWNCHTAKVKEMPLCFLGDTGYCPVFRLLGSKFRIQLAAVPIGWKVETVHRVHHRSYHKYDILWLWSLS